MIAELPQKIGERVRIRGWVNALRDQKRVQFIVLRDETGLAQVVLAKGEQPSELNERLTALTAESAVTLTGTVAADERVNLGGLELKLEQLEVDSLAEPEVPIAARLGARQADRLALPGPAPARAQADVRGAEHDRARDARLLAQRAVHRDPHAEADGLGERVRARSCSRRSTSIAPPIWRSRRSSTSRWRWPPGSARCSRSARCFVPTRRSPHATTPSSRASTPRSPGSTRTTM